MKTMSWKKHKKELLKDTRFKKKLDEIEPEFELARQIVKQRIKRKMTQMELAKRAGTQQAVISRIESGTANPRFDSLERIGKALNKRLKIEYV